ncbi:MAG TPA: hypothetical protein VMM38_04575 [Aridibacter sp.]|nr:hypothetical protein [Aridibacter sp.]
MKTRVCLVFVIVLSLLFSISAQDDKLVQTYSGTLAPGAERTFGFPAKKGQSVNAVITSDDGNVIINEEEGATDLSFDASEGQNTITIINRGQSPDRYKLVITVFTPEPEPTEKIALADGANAVTVGLTMYPYKFKRRFSVRLKKGTGALVKIAPAEARERLEFRLEDAPEGRERWKEGEASLIIMADDDGEYVFEVSKADEILLEAKMTIELLDENDFSDPR